MNKISIKDARDKTIYSVLSATNEKHVKVWGYLHYNEENWISGEYNFAELPLGEFIERMQDSDGFLDTWLSEHKLYEYDMYSDEEAQACLDNYSELAGAPHPFPLSKLTLDTPVGFYIDLEPAAP